MSKCLIVFKLWNSYLEWVLSWIGPSVTANAACVHFCFWFLFPCQGVLVSRLSHHGWLSDLFGHFWRKNFYFGKSQSPIFFRQQQQFRPELEKQQKEVIFSFSCRDYFDAELTNCFTLQNFTPKPFRLSLSLSLSLSNNHTRTSTLTSHHPFDVRFAR